VQGTSMVIARTQAYALRRLEALVDRTERSTKVGTLADALGDADGEAQEWLAVLARCVQLQEELGVLELDRVLDSTPDQLDQHRHALAAARSARRAIIAQATERLLTSLRAAGGDANRRVLFHPNASPAVVRTSNRIAADVGELRAVVGVAEATEALDVRRWGDAATEAGTRALEAGTDGVGDAIRVGGTAIRIGCDAAMTVAERIAERVRRRGDR